MKTRFSVLFAALVTACVIFGGCSNTADSSGGTSNVQKKYSGDIAGAIDGIKTLPNGGSITIVLDSNVATISDDLKNALKDPNKKVALDLSEAGVTSIGDFAFGGCTSLTSVEIPSSVASIGERAFIGCTSLIINVATDNQSYSSYAGALYNKDKTTIISAPSAKGSFKIPDGVTSIDEYAFTYCESLTSVKIPNSVKSIGNYAFGACTSLTSVEIPSGVTSIGEHTFRVCESLTSVKIPDSVTSIGDFAFGGCTSLTSVAIPSSVTSIGEFAFGDCTSLTSVTIPDGVNISTKAFMGCRSLTTIKYAGTKNDWNIKITSFGDYWREYVPAKGVTCSDGKTYAFAYPNDPKGTLSDKVIE